MTIKLTENRLRKLIKEAITEYMQYNKLGVVIWIDDNSDSETYLYVRKLYKQEKYEDMLNYLAKYDYNEDCDEYVNHIGKYDEILCETDEYILVTVNPIHYDGERAFGLYKKMKEDE